MSLGKHQGRSNWNGQQKNKEMFEGEEDREVEIINLGLLDDWRKLILDEVSGILF